MLRRAPLRVEISASPPAEARTLRTRIRALSPSPARTRSAEAALAGAFAVALIPALLPKLVELLNSWMALRKGRSVRVKVSRGDAAIEVEFAPGERGAEELLSLVDRLDGRLEVRKGRRRKQNGPGI